MPPEDGPRIPPVLPEDAIHGPVLARRALSAALGPSRARGGPRRGGLEWVVLPAVAADSVD